MGHIDWLKDKADYIFIPNIVCLHSGEELCVKFMALVDIVRNTFPEVKIIEYTVDAISHQTEMMGLISTGIKITGDPIKSVKAYLKAKSGYKKTLLQKYESQAVKLADNKKTNRLSILIISHPYTTYDNFLGKHVNLFLV